MFFRLIIAFTLLLTGFHTASAQKDSIEAALPEKAVETLPDRAVETLIDSVSKILPKADSVAAVDIRKIEKRDWTTWTPNPNRALWLALVIPGGGQIYNRKYWKLPIIYGGMMGCIYALTWNNMMYRDYSQAYLDIMDSDPTTQSYNKFLHLGATITAANEERYKTLFKSRKDKYRRWRDMSMFCLIGVYALSVIDAYVDAELSEFDISKDLSLKVAPTVIPGGSTFSSGSLENSAVGVNLGLRF